MVRLIWEKTGNSVSCGQRRGVSADFCEVLHIFIYTEILVLFTHVHAHIHT